MLQKMKFPKGLRISNGYLQLCIMHKGQLYIKNFGKPDKLSIEVATIHLAEKRKEILMGTFNISKPLPRKKLRETGEIYFEWWSKELDPNGRQKHGDVSIKAAHYVYNKWLLPYFGEMWHDGIKPKDVQAWRDEYTQTNKGTSANRVQVILSSIFNKIERLVKTERIDPFRLPIENPTKYIEKAKTENRSSG